MKSAIEQFREYLEECIAQEASDLHLASGESPFVRAHGKLKRLGSQALTQDEMNRFVEALLSPKKLHVFKENFSIDLAYSYDDVHRFRINIFLDRERYAFSIRRLSNVFLSFEELGLPPQLKSLTYLRSGLVFVTGPTGSGKSTTLATLINQMNFEQSHHIITIEDPIEFVHPNRLSLVRQRELYADVPTFAQGVKDALREDPDVILIGEMRDEETMRAALMAAETGHLVFSTLHTNSAVGAIERFVGSFKTSEQDAVRHRLSMTLQAVVAQRLLPNMNNNGRVAAVEVLVATTAIANLIRNGKSHQIYSLIEVGGDIGMQTMDYALAHLVVQNLVTKKEAEKYSADPTVFFEQLNEIEKHNIYT